MKFSTYIHKVRHWEYWPIYMFYIPLIPYLLYKAMLAKSITFFMATNPAIKFSGHGTASKFKILNLFPSENIPKSLLIQTDTSLQTIKEELRKNGFKFPVIAKPDVGFRGYLVEKIHDEKHLKTYLLKNKIPIIIQEFVNYKNECGIFYTRIPGEEKGKITSITLKKFMTLKGNGKDTLEQLIKNDDRAYLYIKSLQKIHQEKMFEIPKNKSHIKLSVIGNHSKGTQFLNGNHLINSDLEQYFDTLNKKVKGWFYGRLDIKYNEFIDIKKGDFKILELNGILAEPTHIYDATHQKASYFSAIKTMKNHWKIINTIARKNHDYYQVAYPKFSDYKKEMDWLKKYTKKIKKLAS